MGEQVVRGCVRERGKSSLLLVRPRPRGPTVTLCRKRSQELNQYYQCLAHFLSKDRQSGRSATRLWVRVCLVRCSRGDGTACPCVVNDKRTQTLTHNMPGGASESSGEKRQCTTTHRGPRMPTPHG